MRNDEKKCQSNNDHFTQIYVYILAFFFSYRNEVFLFSFVEWKHIWNAEVVCVCVGFFDISYFIRNGYCIWSRTFCHMHFKCVYPKYKCWNGSRFHYHRNEGWVLTSFRRERKYVLTTLKEILLHPVHIKYFILYSPFMYFAHYFALISGEMV